jgi:hypothetical protein
MYLYQLVLGQLWRLLDVASREPQWSEERSNSEGLKCTSPRQLGGIVGVEGGVEASAKCLSQTGGFEGDAAG